MQTIRVISNIDYNTPEFFRRKIEDWYERGIIDWCYWILHQPDTDETKAHIHFVLKPSRRVDTADLRKDLFEFDPTHPDKPLTCTNAWHFTNSMDEWLLYAVHDVAYLQSKGQVRNIRYDYDDLQATDYDALRADWNAIDRTRFDRLRVLYEAVEKGTPFFQLVQSGLIPITQRAQYEFQYNALASTYTPRTGSGRKQPHEDPETGEIISTDPITGEVLDDVPR